MRKLKDSGVPWIGEIPAEWKILRAKYVASSMSKGSGITKDDIVENGNMPCVRYGEIYSQYDRYFIKCITRTNTERVSSPQYFSHGDILFAGTGELIEEIGKNIVYLGEETCLAGGDIIIFKHQQEPRFLNYALGSATAQIQKSAGKVKLKVVHISAREIGNIVIFLPSLAEQKRIADYLDTKCAKIDAIIARQQQVIEKLKAYKLSVITEAVTRGLNPDVPMKDSGIEWIGLVPKHWEMVRLKFLLSQIIDCPHETPVYSADGNYLVIRTADQDIGKLRTNEDMYRLDESEYWNRIRRMSLEKDDIVYGREGERWGLACLVPEGNKYCLGQRMLQFRCKSELFLPGFAMWALNSKFVYLQGAVDTIGSTSPHVNISTVRNFIIPVPKITEQREIAAHIDKKMLQLDKELEHREILIRKLNEYKKSLIYEVVTGKHTVKEQGGQAHG